MLFKIDPNTKVKLFSKVVINDNIVSTSPINNNHYIFNNPFTNMFYSANGLVSQEDSFAASSIVFNPIFEL